MHARSASWPIEAGRPAQEAQSKRGGCSQPDDPLLKTFPAIAERHVDIVDHPPYSIVEHRLSNVASGELWRPAKISIAGPAPSTTGQLGLGLLGELLELGLVDAGHPRLTSDSRLLVNGEASHPYGSMLTSARASSSSGVNP
jgi:hypothetical protein